MNKTIKAKLPKGFRIEIQESKTFLPFNVLVLVNNLGKRLYVKICEKSDIAEGRIFEILSPSELKQRLNIEESYNGELYTEKGFVIEESLPSNEEELEEALNKGLKKLKDKGKLKSSGQPVNIIISKNEDENDNRELTTQEKRWLFKQSIKEIAQEAKEEENLERAIDEDLEVRTSEDPVGRHKEATGNLSLNEYQTGKSSKQEFSSYEDLIDYLHQSGNKPVLDELWRKQRNALKSGDLPNTILDENTEEFKGQPSIIMKAIQRQNEQLRRKMLEQREKKGE